MGIFTLIYINKNVEYLGKYILNCHISPDVKLILSNMRIVKEHHLSAVLENNSSFSVLPDLLVSEIFSPLKKKSNV